VEGVRKVSEHVLSTRERLLLRRRAESPTFEHQFFTSPTPVVPLAKKPAIKPEKPAVTGKVWGPAKPPKPPKVSRVYEVVCAAPGCGKVFDTTVPNKKYCDANCATEVHKAKQRARYHGPGGYVPKPRKVKPERPAKEPRTVVCRRCGTTAPATGPRSVYCSPICATADKDAQRTAERAKNYPPKPCEWCGMAFTPRSITFRYCGAECRAKAKNEGKWLARQREKGC